MIITILTILSFAVSLYAFLCLISILMSWFPGAKFTSIGRFIDSLTSPYLNFFSKKIPLAFGRIDFSPIISIGILSIVTSILSGISSTGRIYVGGIFDMILRMLWETVLWLASLLLVVIIVRLIVLVINKGHTDYNSPWYNVDQFLNRITFTITKLFIKKSFSYQTALIVSAVTVLVFIVVGTVLIYNLRMLFLAMPF